MQGPFFLATPVNLINKSNEMLFQKVQQRHTRLINTIYTQLQKKPISHFSGKLWKTEYRNENIFIPYSVAISSASFH